MIELQILWLNKIINLEINKTAEMYSFKNKEIC